MKKQKPSNLLQKTQEESLCKKQKLKLKENQGITLIALVVTIIVLLILAGVTITAVLGEDGIIERAQEAADKTKNAVDRESEDFEKINSLISEYGGDTTDPRPETPEGLKVGSTVTYNPSGTYKWQAKYCSSTKTEGTEDVTLSSATGSNFNISSWKVLSINAGKVELVPSKLATGEVYLGGAQGYNNGVKLLNDACESLYGNKGKGITARSINIEDIEKYMTEEAKTSAHTSPPYNTKTANAYTQANSWYPVIYAQENKAVIDGIEKTGGLGMSDTPGNFIERTESVGGVSATEGKLQAKTSIQPYQTYWEKDATYMKTAFKDDYYNLIMPSGTDTTYWIASRCVNPDSSNCGFYVGLMSSGCIDEGWMFFSDNGNSEGPLGVFPVVTLSSGLIESDGEGSFVVK